MQVLLFLTTRLRAFGLNLGPLIDEPQVFFIQYSSHYESSGHSYGVRLINAGKAINIQFSWSS